MNRNYYALIAAAIIVVSGCGPNQDANGPKEQPKAKVVEVYTIKNQKDGLTLSATGLVEAKRDLQLTFGASGTISSLNVVKGTKVSKGQLLAALDTRYYQTELEAAAGQMKQASANRTKTLQGATAEEVTQQRLKLQSAQKRYADAKKAADQSNALFAGGAISQSELDQKKSDLLQTELSLKDEQIRLNELLKGAQAEDIAQVDFNLKQAASAAERAQKTLNETKITAPFAGTVVDVNGQVGQLANPGQTVVHLVDLSEVKVTLDVTNNQIDHFTEGAEVTVSKDGSNKAKGKVTFISPVIDEQTGKYRVEVTVQNASSEWRGGMVATVEVPRKVNGLIVPIDSVGISEAKRYVMAIENGVLKKIEVETGQIAGDKIEILSGVKPGQQLLKSGITYFVEGEKVTAKGE